MKKLYLAHPISTTGEFNDSIRVAKQIEEIFNKEFIGDVSSIEDMGCGDSEINSEGDMKAYLVNQKFEVYAPALNKSINDKSNNPTPEMIYNQDVDNLLSSDVVVVNYTGGDADGTILELGMLAGVYEMLMTVSKINNEVLHDEKEMKRFAGDVKYDTGVALSEEQAFHAMQNATNRSLVNSWETLPAVLVYSSNKRALQPQLWNGIASGKLNHMVLGAIEKHFVWCGTEEDMLYELEQM